MCLLGAKSMGQIHGFVNHHPVGCFRVIGQLAGGQTQNGPFHLVQRTFRTVQIGREGLIKGSVVDDHFANQGLEKGFVNAREVLLDEKLLDNGRCRAVVELPLVQRLQRPPAGPLFWLEWPGFAALSHCAICCLSFIMASTAAAASRPLSMRPGSARSSACSSFSGVSTPKPTGRPESSETRCRPRAHSAEMNSKWAVSPRTTAPRAMIPS